MNEEYTITVFLDQKYISGTTVFDKTRLADLLNSTDNNMKALGYRRVSTKRSRISRKDRRHITNYSLGYTRI